MKLTTEYKTLININGSISLALLWTML